VANPSVSIQILRFSGLVLKIRGQKPAQLLRVAVEQHTKIRKHKYSDGTCEIHEGQPDYYWAVDVALGCPQGEFDIEFSYEGEIKVLSGCHATRSSAGLTQGVALGLE
jgi:hypothetical protein